MIYLDNAAGTRPYPEVIETITDVLTNHWGNASAGNSLGQDARIIINNVTEKVADDINCDPTEIIWTSGACEANSLAVIGVLSKNPHMRFFTTHLEHTSILEIVKGGVVSNPVFFLDNNHEGKISTRDLYKKLAQSYRDGARVLVSVSFANSEIGVIQDIGTIANIVHDFGGILHVDATQVYPWNRIDVKALGIDLMSISGQKLHCVKGVGFLYVKDGINIKPIIYGSQQNKLRGGTMPTHLIAAFGTALEKIRCINSAVGLDLIPTWRDEMLESLLAINGVILNGPKNDRLPNNISITIDGVDAETLVTMCNLMGVIIAKGSACKSYEPTPSEALLAIGLTPQQALNTIRISLGHFNNPQEIKQATDIIIDLIARIREENS